MQVTTQIVQPDTTDTTWIPLEETIQVIGQRGVSIQHPNVLIVTHVRAFEHFKYPVSRNVTVLCVGSKTKAYLGMLCIISPHHKYSLKTGTTIIGYMVTNIV